MDFKLVFFVLATFAVVMVAAEYKSSERDWRLQVSHAIFYVNGAFFN